ncbi:hypothetical protein P3X46_021936 [Hevea brasiliensis]|uniref:Retrotransposon gag domain-containing protein n=1 Tax=Hevea brasiliensis TaxID=3981 RepID=A0ABQ9LH41_HEVBR|nr:hypothetical protein P3X46_021936 [Hevea brasiliensis]
MATDLRTPNKIIISITPTVRGDPPATIMTQNLTIPMIPSGAPIPPHNNMEDKNFGLGDESPLSGLILVEQFPPKFKLPVLDKYGGTTNPRSHVANFQTIMMLQNVNDYHLCRVFSIILIGLAQKWYQHLKLGSIQNFNQLTTKFKNKIISYIPPKKLFSDLWKIKQ